jgi:hypothetical protein
MIVGAALFVITSHRDGFSFPGLAIPYYTLQDAGVAVELCSVRGGTPHPDPASFSKDDRSLNPDEVNRFLNDVEAMYKLENSRPLETYSLEGYDALYLVGGAGALRDFPIQAHLKSLALEGCRRAIPVAAADESASALLEMKFESLPAFEACPSVVLGREGQAPQEMAQKIRDRVLAAKGLSNLAGNGVDMGEGLSRTLGV